MFLKRFEREIYAAFRIVVGLLFMMHGSQKLLGYPVSGPADLPAVVTYVTAPIELVGGLLVMVGLMAGWAAFLGSGLMAAAYWIAHGLKAIHPIENGGELAVLFCFSLMLIAARGSGSYSIDSFRK